MAPFRSFYKASIQLMSLVLWFNCSTLPTVRATMLFRIRFTQLWSPYCLNYSRYLLSPLVYLLGDRVTTLSH